MFERFTGGARHLVVDAQEQARVMRHPSIGSEHLLLSLTRVGGGVAVEVLEARGVTETAVRAEIDRLVGGGAEATEQRAAAAGHIPFTPNAKKTLELALREAMHLGHDAISCEHVAIALTSESYTVAARVLTALDVDPPQLRRDLLARADEFAAALEDVPDGPAGLSQSAVIATPSASAQRRAAFAGPWSRPLTVRRRSRRSRPPSQWSSVSPVAQSTSRCS
jgi:ATP-dependent Clp protease ATP-binding subunit ClpC